MKLMVNVSKSFEVEIDESVYNEEMINSINEYWGLDGYTQEDTLEFVADMITSHYLKYGDLNGLEGIARDEDAHKIKMIYDESDVSEVN